MASRGAFCAPHTVHAFILAWNKGIVIYADDFVSLRLRFGLDEGGPVGAGGSRTFSSTAHHFVRVSIFFRRTREP
jgi:hypothetical protein